MKDYLSAEERNQMMVFMVILEMFKGNRGITGPSFKNILDDWSSRNNLSKDEHKNLKLAQTYLKKFCESVLNRMNVKEKNAIAKRLEKFDFRLVDDYTLKKVYRGIQDKMVNAVIPREQFNNWCCEIMDVRCKNCNKNWKECELHEVFDNNFIPESTWRLENCRYAYKKIEKKDDKK